MKLPKLFLFITIASLISCSSEDNENNYKNHIGDYELFKCITDADYYPYADGTLNLASKEDSILVLFSVELTEDEKVEFRGYVKDDFIIEIPNNTLFGSIEEAEYGIKITQFRPNGEIAYGFWKSGYFGNGSNGNNSSSGSNNGNSNSGTNGSGSGNSGVNNGTNTTTGRCAAYTKKGARCKRNADKGSSYCWQHK